MTVRVDVDGTPVTTRDGDTVLMALARAGRLPGGCLCLAGDCPHCLAVVDGVPHTRMCATPAREGMVVETTPVSIDPPLPAPITAPVGRRFAPADVVVIGGGTAGRAEAERLRAAGRDVTVLETADGAEALAVYEGPEVVARIAGDVVRLHADEVIVATGSVEIHPTVPGAHLAGILTPRAATALTRAGVDLGVVVAVGGTPDEVTATSVTGPVLRFEGETRVEAVVVVDGAGHETRHACDTVTVDLGVTPRDLLARMAPGTRTVGGAAAEGTLPDCPPEGVVCPCSGVTTGDLRQVWEHGFRDVELIKRATLAGTGTCQGVVCSPYLRAFVAEREGVLRPTFTARPLARQMTVAEAAAGFRLPPVQRTRLDHRHRALGARMDRVGGWFRPWNYPDPDAEYAAVRERVSIGDVGTLGKMVVTGPDVVGFLERLYPCRVGDLGHGRSRYALLLAESGGVMDDGLISRVDESTFHLTFTSGGASQAEAWVRDWAHAFRADVRIMDRTRSLGAINVTGPLARRLLERAGMDEDLAFMRHGRRSMAGIPCHVYRLSFTGEASYELHHPARHSVELWDTLLELGRDLGIAPHGIRTLQALRLEKGHVIVGMDTEPDSTPRRLGMDWAVRMDKGDFVGRAALERTDALPPTKRLVGLTMSGPPPTDGTPVVHDGRIRGYVTSAAWSPALGHSVMLAWLPIVDGAPPESVVVDGRSATRTPTPFYDPEGARARA